MGAARRSGGHAIARPVDCSQPAWLQSASRAAHTCAWRLGGDHVGRSRGAGCYTVVDLTIARRPYHRRRCTDELLSPDRSYSAWLLRCGAVIGRIPRALEPARTFTVRINPGRSSHLAAGAGLARRQLPFVLAITAGDG